MTHVALGSLDMLETASPMKLAASESFYYFNWLKFTYMFFFIELPY